MEERRERDAVLVEERLEIRVHGERLAVTMRPPANDNELALRVNVNAPQELAAP